MTIHRSCVTCYPTYRKYGSKQICHYMVQSNHYQHATLWVRIALYKATSLDSELHILPSGRQVIDDVLEPGEKRLIGRGSSPELRCGLIEYSVCVCLPFHTSHVSTRWSTSWLSGRGKWKLFSCAAEIIISDKIMSSNIEDPQYVPLIQCITSLYISFVDCPTFRPVEHYRGIMYTVSQKKLSRFVFVRTLSNFHKFQ